MLIATPCYGNMELVQDSECASFFEPVRDLILETPNMSGFDVLKLQNELKALSFYKGELDGVYGLETQHAVVMLQEAIGIKADGVVEETTRQELENLIIQAVANSNVPAPPGKVDIIIDTKKRLLTIFSDGEPFKQYSVANGKMETPTPIGNWGIRWKGVNWGTGFGTRWIGLTVPWGIYGVHGTNKPHSIGSYASHGCIRMHNRNVEEIYPWVQKDARIIIVGNPFTYNDHPFRLMRHNSRGSDVMEIQRLLKRYGYYNGPIDGIWGGGLERAIVEFRKDNGLRHDNSVDHEMYEALGI